jgi:hypothetical protein
VIRAREGDDPGPTGHEESRPERYLDGILPCHAEHHLATSFADPRSELACDIGLGQVAERMDAAGGLLLDRALDVRVPMAEGGDAEPPGEVDVLPAARVDDAATFGLGPDHGRSLFSVSIAT